MLRAGQGLALVVLSHTGIQDKPEDKTPDTKVSRITLSRKQSLHGRAASFPVLPDTLEPKQSLQQLLCHGEVLSQIKAGSCQENQTPVLQAPPRAEQLGLGLRPTSRLAH